MPSYLLPYSADYAGQFQALAGVDGIIVINTVHGVFKDLSGVQTKN